MATKKKMKIRPQAIKQDSSHPGCAQHGQTDPRDTINHVRGKFICCTYQHVLFLHHADAS